MELNRKAGINGEILHSSHSEKIDPKNLFAKSSSLVSQNIKNIVEYINTKDIPAPRVVVEEVKSEKEESKEHLAFFQEVLELADGVAEKLEKKKEPQYIRNFSLPSNN